MTATATGAEPLPDDGVRRLSPQAALQRAKAMACVRDKNSTQCQGRIHVNIFFDGTGNNWNWNGPFVMGKTRSKQTQRNRNSHSNVTRLWDACYDEPDHGLYAIYIPGVGTPFDKIDDSGDGFDGVFGAAMARKGADRINWGIVQLYNAIHRYVTNDDALIPDDSAQTIVNNMSSAIGQLGFENAARRMILRNWESKLAAAVKGGQRKLLQVTLSVFGFSRGAAQARAFVHWLYEIARLNNDGCAHVLAGVPLRFNFLGIFDTVASVGVSALSRVTEGKMAWADGNMMSIHPAVENCVHFAALHEQRINFPLDLAIGSNVKEVLYPGMHSDVGGGYSPGGQGKGMPAWGGSAHLSQVPLVDMHYEAIKAGVPLMTIDEIRHEPALAKAFSCDARLVRSYNGWLAAHGVGQGAHAAQIRQHSRQYLRWRGLRLRTTADSMLKQRFFQEADAEDRVDLANAQTVLAKRITGIRQAQEQSRKNREVLDMYVKQAQEAAKRGAPVPAPMLPSVSSDLQDAELMELFNQVNDQTPLPPAVIALFDDYVHDSIAGFYILKFTELTLPGLSTKGYLRYRGVYSVKTTDPSISASCQVPKDPLAVQQQEQLAMTR